ncbi:MAG: glycosyltransferase [Bacteroidales bacterium]|jgi:cellulose synthase/poly-beta-1,6-N-acetylglucosamine synthase-like glycosyltransferase
MYLFLALFACYALLIIAYSFGWFSIRTWKRTGEKPSTKVSVIVPARNESENIVSCLEGISSQTYPESLYEIIVVDDSSDDNTVEVVKGLISNSLLKNIRLIELSDKNIHGKKQAITEAIKVSTGDFIITTDADCRLTENWISAIVEYYERYKPAMIAGPVCFTEGGNSFQRMQGLEFLSLISSGAAAMKLGMPIMCNGANLAYEKEAFIEAGGYDANNKYTSGDDIFLMLALKKTSKRKIAFIKCMDAIVYTSPQPTLKNFTNQRKRWASKSRGYADIAIVSVALLVFLFNLSLIASAVLALLIKAFLPVFLIGFIVKIVVDFPILIGITSFMKQKKLLLFYFPLQLIYPFYIILTACFGLFAKFEWKKRSYTVYGNKE